MKMRKGLKNYNFVFKLEATYVNEKSHSPWMFCLHYAHWFLYQIPVEFSPFNLIMTNQKNFLIAISLNCQHLLERITHLIT